MDRYVMIRWSSNLLLCLLHRVMCAPVVQVNDPVNTRNVESSDEVWISAGRRYALPVAVYVEDMALTWQFSTRPKVHCSLQLLTSVFRWHCWQAFCLIEIVVTVLWSVYLSRACSVLKQQKISTHFLLHTTAPFHSQIFKKNWLTLVNSFLPSFAPN